MLVLAHQEAQRLNHVYVGTEHILLGLVKPGSGFAVDVLKDYGVELRTIRIEVEKILQHGPEVVVVGKWPQTPRAKKAIEYAVDEARRLGHHFLGTEHLLLGLLREQEGVAAHILMHLGIKLSDVREEIWKRHGISLESARIDSEVNEES